MISRPLRALGVLFAVLLVGAATVAAAPAPGGSVRSEDLRIDVLDGPARDQPQSLDATLWLPATSGPAPAVLVAHGFGGSKDSVAERPAPGRSAATSPSPGRRAGSARAPGRSP